MKTEMKPVSADVLRKEFYREFQQEPILVRSPGRVNIIGEHTDYNGGFVLPAAIDHSVIIAAQKREDATIKLLSATYDNRFESNLNDLHPSKTNRWVNYMLGVADQLQKRGYKIGGFNMALDGDVPIGSGMSSSAAVECATVAALSELFELNIDPLVMVQIAQKAEHTFAGVQCGIMDQFASMFGKQDQLIKLDCRSLEYEYVPLKLDGYKIVLFNSNVKHSLASTAYNERRAQCEEGVAMIQRKHPQVSSLRDVNMPMLDEIVKPVAQLIYTRCKYVVEENERLISACNALQNGDIETLGKRMFESHEGLSKEYEVSCPEMDFLVDFVKGHPAVLGARMMGGGFGGCTINLVKEDSIDTLKQALGLAYSRIMNKELTTIISKIEDGTSVIR